MGGPADAGSPDSSARLRAGPVPPVDPRAAKSLARRLASRAAGTDVGLRIAGWYLRNMVPRVEPALSGWTSGHLTSLPITPVVFLHAVGARTGEPRVTLLTYFTEGDDVILIASNYGRPTNPAWYHNVKSRADVTLRARGREGRYRVHETTGAERDRLWSLAVQWTPPLARYQSMTGGRTIPVMRCQPSTDRPRN
jgi:deazaflavin-dependent oxidoreductase (nitroreductase family)